MSGTCRLNVFYVSTQVIELLVDNALSGSNGGTTKNSCECGTRSGALRTAAVWAAGEARAETHVQARGVAVDVSVMLNPLGGHVFLPEFLEPRSRRIVISALRVNS